MKRVRCPRCDQYTFFDETKYESGQSLVFQCPQCGKEFGIRLGVSKLKNTRKEENIEEEAKEHNGEYVTNEKEKLAEKTEYDFDTLKEEFSAITGELMNKDPKVGPRIVAIVDKYLGKGKKVQNLQPEQAELLFLVVTELKDTFK